MYRIGELAKMAEVTPDMIRYYEEQQMMKHEVRTEGGFRPHTESNLQRLKFTRHVRQPGSSLGSIRELLSIRIDSEHCIHQELKGIVQERLQEVEARIVELQGIQYSLQRLNDTCCRTAHNSVHCSIPETLEQGVSGAKSGCRFFALVGLYPRR